jgi:hypothetical protein
MIVSRVLCITDGMQIRKVMVFLQSCTVSLPGLDRLSSETSVTCTDGYDVIRVKREVDSDTDCEGQETAVAISFPKIKSEQEEVSYITACPLLGALCRYTEIFTPIHHLHISVNPFKRSSLVNGNFFLYLDCVRQL